MISSSIIFGCEQLGGFNWGDYDIKDVEYAIRYGLDNKVNTFDTADCYGNGLSEERLGKILKDHNREHVNINTKFGVRIDNKGKRFIDNSIDWIVKALDNSLKRLNTDFIDTYFLHSWDEISSLKIIFDKLEDLKKIGKIKNYGFSNISSINSDNVNLNNINAFSLEYSLLNQKNKSDIEYLTNKNIKFYPYGVLGQGMLSGKYDLGHIFSKNDRRNNDKYENFHGVKFRNNIEKINKLKTIATSLNVNLPAFCVQYVIKSFKNTFPIVGFKNIKQLQDIITCNSLKCNIWELLNDKNI